MAHQVSMRIDPKDAQSQKQTQRLIMLPQMQQAIQLLQVSVMELSTIVEAEMELNPILEYAQDDVDDAQSLANNEFDDDYEAPTSEMEEMRFEDQNFEVLRQLDDDFRDHFAESENYSITRTAEDEKRRSFLESAICEEESLFEHLMSQARESFGVGIDLEMAETLIGFLDANGYLGTPLQEIVTLYGYNETNLQRVLKQIQAFDPTGVGAFNMQDSLLIQLRAQRKQKTLAYTIIEQCYDDLLHNRIPHIAKCLGSTSDDISRAISKDILKLDLHPGALFGRGPVQHIVPDVTIRKEGEKLIVETNEEPIPRFRLNRRYLRMLDDPTVSSETAEFIKEKIASAKWLMRTIDQRNDTVTRIAQSLAVRQADFFLRPDGKMVPLTMKVLADELELHESTIARAVSNKYLNCSKGIVPLRSFFTSALVSEKGDEVSSNTARDLLRKLLEVEDKHRPLSDEAISKLMLKQGIQCARRTIAKYRGELGLGNAQQRRVYH